MEYRGTLDVARGLGIPEWRLEKLIRQQLIPTPTIIGRIRVWSVDDVGRARAKLEELGVLKPVGERTG